LAIANWLTRLLQRLPKFITRVTSSNVYKLFNTIARELSLADADMAYAKSQVNISTAEGVALDLHGADYAVPRRAGETLWDMELRFISYVSSNQFSLRFGDARVTYYEGAVLRITQGVNSYVAYVEESSYDELSDITTITLTDGILIPGIINMVEIQIVTIGETDVAYRQRLLDSYNRPQLTRPALLSILRPVSFQPAKIEEYISDRWFAMEAPQTVVAESQTSTSLNTMDSDYNIAVLEGIWVASDLSSSYGYANNATYINTYTLSSSAYSPSYNFNDSSILNLSTDLPEEFTNVKLTYSTNLTNQAFVGINTIAQYQAIRLNSYKWNADSATEKFVGVDECAYLEEWNAEQEAFAYVSANSFKIFNGNYCGKYQINSTIRVILPSSVVETLVANSVFDYNTNSTTVTVGNSVLIPAMVSVEVFGNVVSTAWVREADGLMFTWTSLVKKYGDAYYFEIKDEYRTDYYWRRLDVGTWDPIILDYLEAYIPYAGLVFVGMYDPIYRFQAFISKQRILYGTNVYYGTKRVYGGFLGVSELSPWKLLDDSKPAGTQFTIRIISPYDYSAYFGLGIYGRAIYGQENYF
jgi:hypothetical protein